MLGNIIFIILNCVEVAWQRKNGHIRANLTFVQYFIDPLAGDSSAGETVIRRFGGWG
jgi:hypothetical protein